MPSTKEKTSKKVKTEQFVTTPRERELGICETCNHAPECVNLKVAQEPIWFCDQFEDYMPPAETLPSPAKLKKAAKLEQDGNGAYLGLCQTCAHKDNCANLRPGMGVWHCEEYE